MNDVALKLDPRGQGAFYIMEGTEQIAEMVISVAPTVLTVYHTEVAPKAEGQGLAKKLLETMVNYARSKGLKVIPLCPYVHAQFKRHPEQYRDVWLQEEEKEGQA